MRLNRVHKKNLDKRWKKIKTMPASIILGAGEIGSLTGVRLLTESDLTTLADKRQRRKSRKLGVKHGRRG